MFIYLQDIRTGPRKRSFLEEQHFENTIGCNIPIYDVAIHYIIREVLETRVFLRRNKQLFNAILLLPGF